MYQIGLLLLTGPLRIVYESIPKYLKCCNKNVVKRLYIKLEPEFYNPWSKLETAYLKHLSEFIPLVYNKASLLCQNLDVRIILSDREKLKTGIDYTTKFDVILTNSKQDEPNISNYIHNSLKGTYDAVIKLDEKDLISEEDSQKEQYPFQFQVYNTVCLGGTFDRLHNGHKVLLSEAALRARKKLIVGVTDGTMIQKKVLWELIEPIQKRISDVNEFLLDVDPSLSYEIVPITDPYGPTIVDPDIDCIIVSEETKIGGEKVNAERKNRGMRELSLYVVHLVENADKIPGEEEKLSSSTRRKQLLGTSLKQPEVSLLDPYTIFLQGLPHTGKSCITFYFQREGGIVINCSDIIKSILDEEEERKAFLLGLNENSINNVCMDYPKLISICLVDKEKRKWAASYLSEKVEDKIKQKTEFHQKQGAKFILIQDSLLLELKLKCNEVWSTLMPVIEVETHLNKSYGLSKEDAKNAVLHLPNNAEYLEKSHRVFCTLWSPEFTEQQVLRAWEEMTQKIQ